MNPAFQFRDNLDCPIPLYSINSVLAPAYCVKIPFAAAATVGDFTGVRWPSAQPQVSLLLRMW